MGGLGRFNPGAARWLSLALLTTGLVDGCASVTVRKVPTPTQYVHWTDDMQREADSIKGIRFYLPRPFVNVFESFPVRTDVNFAQGFVSPDGKYVSITKIWGVDGSPVAAKINVPADSVVYPPASIKPQGLSGTTRPSPPSSIITPPSTDTAPPAPPSPLPPQSPAPETGVNKQSSTNNNMAFAYEPLRGNFDLVYMPDFEEQYAVDSIAGLGNANFQVNLGQGWSLQGFNSLSDNSELNKRIFDLIDTSMQLAKTAANAELGQLFPILQQAAKTLPQTGTNAIRPEGAGGVTLPPQKGTPVMMKIIVLHYAAKGLYPVVKPRELQERAIPPSKTVYAVWDLFRIFPKVEWASDYSINGLRNAQTAQELPSSSRTTPYYPYQYLSFNTFRYVAVEVIKPDSPFSTKYSATGTDGEAGAARTGDPIDLLKQLKALYSTDNPSGNPVPPDNNPLPADQNKQPPPKAPSAAVQRSLDDAIVKIHLPGDATPNYSLSQPDWSSYPTLLADLTMAGGHPAMSEKEAQAAFLKQISQKINSPDVKVENLQFTNRPTDLDALDKFYAALKDPKQVAYPKPDGTGGGADYKVADAWLVTKAGDPKGPQQGTLYIQTAPMKTPAPNDTPDELKAAFQKQANDLLSAQHLFKPDVTVTDVQIANQK
jgi:hypothetical protein